MARSLLTILCFRKEPLCSTLVSMFPKRLPVTSSLMSKLKAFTLDNDKESLGSLPERFESLCITADNLLIGIEATGSFWENIYSLLKNKGFNVVLLNPYNTNKFREALAKKVKTDDIDALVIAQNRRVCSKPGG